ncbi:MAG: hypothetical protein AB8B63_23925 [Granulosicoccus sp.]
MPVKSSAEIAIPKGEGKIIILFQDFAESASCTIKTPEGDLELAELPGRVEYPGSSRASLISCDNGDGSNIVFDIDALLPESFKIAGTTARPDGSMFITVSSDQGLFQIQNEEARELLARD